MHMTGKVTRMGVRSRMWSSVDEGWLLVIVLMVLVEWTPVGARGNPFASYNSGNKDGEVDPEFVNTPTHVTVKEGALAILPCWVRYLGKREVAWRRLSDDTFLTIGRVTWVQDSNLVLEHLRKGDGVTSWDLIFRQARLDQAGDYECQVTSQDKHVRMVTLTVIDEPTFNSQVIVPTGQMIHLVCNVSAINQTNFDLHWYKNGRRVDSDTYPYFVVTRYQVQSTQMFVTDLIIDNASLDDSGIYTCRSSSRQVIDTTKVTVIRSDPSSSKREESREDLIPESAGEMLDDDVLGEHNVLPEDTHSFFSTDRLPSKSSDSKSGSSGVHRQPGLWLVLCLPALLSWGFLLLLLRQPHIPLDVILLPAS